MNFFAFLLVACVAQVCNSSPARRDLVINALPEVNDLTPSASSNIIDAKINIEATIQEVEDLIKSNPKLPRLTRGEILDIIENITKTDKEQANKTNNRDQKAVMYVMPYSPDNAQNGDVQALYTKPPVTHLVNDQKQKQVPKNQIEAISTKPKHKSVTRATTKSPFIIIEDHPKPETSTRPRTHMPEIVTQTPMTTTTIPFRPLRRRTTTKQPTTRFTNHKYPEEEKVHPIYSPEVVTPQIQTSKPLKTVKPSEVVTPQIQTARPFKPMTNQGINIIAPPKLNVKTHYKQPPASTQPKPSLAPVIPDNMELPDDFKDVLKNLDVLLKGDPSYNQHESVLHIINSEAAKPPPVFQKLPDHSTTTITPEFEQVANNLSPDMKDLLMSFGLIPDPNKAPADEPKPSAMEPSVEISPESYSSFKPLPNAYSSSNDESMDDFLAKFGLGTKSGQRSQKAISMSKPQNDINLDGVPDDLKKVLKDIGITYKDMKQLKKVEKQHVFNPADTQYATVDEIDKLNKLVGVIKQLEKLNGSATDEDLKHIDFDELKQLVGSLNLPLDKQVGPDPLDYDKSLGKNEVKRQQSTTTTTTTEAAAVSNQANNPSLADLEDSFGGSSDAVRETATTTTAEPPRKSGFYYLVDWNTFFDIDNQNGKRVNLRFQPTIGDPKRFFSVNVP